ncbi:MAG: SirB2 family protein [Proteobacteria bacterium]|uniref:SirB2 family protein n=1 Tax=Piscinibacter sp. TaxID=1903157 RepID=UPI001B61B1C6|nr:SirB2 family protein [Piscinibacter sp.]MBP5991334.1 SirB2 family protein [Piscinibacter sp.]MBP6028516.1 SirB2 family protein [Piscinibacter sp.]MBS0444128.1 SirB2 family protein [Pseudomonadota bacterium]
MDYFTLKLIHQSAVTLSITGFVARGAAALTDAAWVRSRAARTLPHIVDTVLLVSAITLAWTLRLNPLTTPWLGAKIVGLLAYIVLGMLALKPTRPRGVRIAAWLAALLCFAQIVATAITKSALGLLAFV